MPGGKLLQVYISKNGSLMVCVAAVWDERPKVKWTARCATAPNKSFSVTSHKIGHRGRKLSLGIRNLS